MRDSKGFNSCSSGGLLAWDTYQVPIYDVEMLRCFVK